MTIAAKLVAIMGDLPGIEKKKHQGGVTYAYRGIEEITTELQPLLVKHGVVITPFATLISVVPLPEKGEKNNWTRTTIQVNYEISDAEGNDSIVAGTIGVGDDNADKGVNKSMTQAFKYLLLQTFCISDPADDGDSIPNPESDGTEQTGPVVRRSTSMDESPEPPPEGWTNAEVAASAHSQLSNRVKALSPDQIKRCSEIRQEVGGGWPLALKDYEVLGAFVAACEAFGPDAVPTTDKF